MKLIFPNIEDFAKYLPVQVTTNFDALKPAIETAQDTFMIPIVSKAYWDILMDTIINPTDGQSDEQLELIEKIKYPLAHLTFLNMIPLLDIQATPGGFQVNSSVNSAPASSNRVKEFTKQIMINSQMGLNKLIEFLEANADNYSEYETSQERKDLKSGFVNDVKTLNTYLGVQIGWFVFRQMKSIIRRIEEDTIKSIICSPLYELMITQISESGDLDVYAPLLPFIQRAVVYQSFHEALEEIGLQVDPRGVYINQDSSGTFENIKGQKPKLGDDLARLKELYSSRSQTAFEKLAKELKTNVSNYPLYETSECYSTEISSGKLKQNNTTKIFIS